jgi:hypothetical protein
MSMSLLEIKKEIRALPRELLRELTGDLMEELAASDTEKRRTAIRSTAGAMAGEAGADFERNVRESADRLDANE